MPDPRKPRPRKFTWEEEDVRITPPGEEASQVTPEKGKKKETKEMKGTSKAPLS